MKNHSWGMIQQLERADLNHLNIKPAVNVGDCEINFLVYKYASGILEQPVWALPVWALPVWALQRSRPSLNDKEIG